MSFYTVNEGESALVLRLGKIVSDSKTAYVEGAGLHSKIPFIDHVHIFDTRMQQLSTPKGLPLTVGYQRTNVSGRRVFANGASVISPSFIRVRAVASAGQKTY